MTICLNAGHVIASSSGHKQNKMAWKCHTNKSISRSFIIGLRDSRELSKNCERGRTKRAVADTDLWMGSKDLTYDNGRPERTRCFSTCHAREVDPKDFATAVGE